MSRDQTMAEKSNDTNNSNYLDPKIIAVLSKIPEEPALDTLKQWLIDNQVHHYITDIANAHFWSCTL